MDEALSLAVGARGVRLGAQVPDAGSIAGLAEEVTPVAVAVVGHDTLDGDAMASEPSKGSAKERYGTFLSFVRQDLGIGEA